MFLRRRRPDATPPAGAPPRPGDGRRHPAVVGADGRLAGRLSGALDVILEGRLAGEIAIDGELTVMPSGEVEGPVSARSVIVAGRIHGDVRGEERVEIARGGHVEGDVVSARVVLAEGSVLNGRVDVLVAAEASGSGQVND